MEMKNFRGVIPAIISKELFYKVQKILEKNRKAPSASKADMEYILTSKLICDSCGNKMKGFSGKGKLGVKYRYYTCKTLKKENPKCNQKNISKELLEDIVVKNAKDLLNNENINIIANKVYQACQEANNKSVFVKEYEKQIAVLEKSINNLLSAIEKGENLDLINERLNQNRKELEKNKKLLTQEKKKINNINIENIKFFLNQIKNGDIRDIEYRKKLINIFVNEIHLHENQLIIVFNVSNQKITLPAPLTAVSTGNVSLDRCLYLPVMVSQEGFEPPTLGLEGQCSIQLSY